MSQLSIKRTTSAVFSDCKRYRYDLRRTWQDNPRLLHFCMLNPSTADDIDNDPTVERCERRAKALGFGGLIVTNIFAWRSTDPRVLKTLANPVGDKTDRYKTDGYIFAATYQASMTICGWGDHGKLIDRGMIVARMLRAERFPLHYLNLNKSGHPTHPLYIGYEVQPKEWKI